MRLINHSDSHNYRRVHHGPAIYADKAIDFIVARQIQLDPASN